MKMDEIEKRFWECPDPPFPATSTPVITNYDRLISKTPEEMAEWLAKYNEMSTVCPNFGAHDCHATCKQCWLDWLKSPVEVDDG